MIRVGLKSPALALHGVLVVVLAYTVNLPCASQANGNFKECCTQGMGCGEKAGSEEEAKDCCTKKGTFDTPSFQTNSEGLSIKAPDVLAVRLIGMDEISEASLRLYQSFWSREILKVPLGETYKLTCTYRI